MNNEKTKMNKFKVGQELSARSIGDHECIFRATVISRTDKMITIKMSHNRQVKRKVNIDSEGNEMIFPNGKYSMAATFHAK